MPAGVRYVNCPRCGTPVAWLDANPFRPFCSERCKTVDFGVWSTERYRVAAVENDEEPEGGTPPEPAQ